MDTNPNQITDSEWKEIVQVREVREGWGIDATEDDVMDWKQSVYGVRYDFMSGSPGYCGDVFILLGDGLTMPIVLVRNRSGELEAHYE